MSTTDTPAAEARIADALNQHHWRGTFLGCLCGWNWTEALTHGCGEDERIERSHAAHQAAVIAAIRPPASVIPADTRPYETQTAALAALPVHTLVSYRDHDGELHTLEKGDNSFGDHLWWETTSPFFVTTYNLVRNEVDYTIVRMGDGS